ncbi:hypothetical protein [Streptomyces coeruleoprunus]|uniref:hypothetical protein n=1 Tax=Streptomyces coeruleoprunus TaxID=285563 RepID=UPI0031F0F30B
MRVAHLGQGVVAGAVAEVGRAVRDEPGVALQTARHGVVEEHGQFGGYAVAGAGAGHVLAGEAVDGLLPGAGAALVGQVVLHDPYGGDGDAVHDVAERAEHRVEHLGRGEEFDERAQRVAVRVGVGVDARVRQPQHAGGGRPQGERAPQDAVLGAAHGQADDLGWAVRVELFVQELVGDEPGGVVDDEEPPLVAALRGVQGGADGLDGGEGRAAAGETAAGEAAVGRAVAELAVAGATVAGKDAASGVVAPQVVAKATGGAVARQAGAPVEVAGGAVVRAGPGGSAGLREAGVRVGGRVVAERAQVDADGVGGRAVVRGGARGLARVHSSSPSRSQSQG